MIEGRIAIVTGAASGIGLATARRLAEAGATVIGLDRKAEITSFRQYHSNMSGLRCDLTDAIQIRTALDKSLGRQPIDILVNNAGINPSPATLGETSENLWQLLLDTNLTSIYLMTKAVLAHMQTGVIVNISSILGISGAKKNAAYAATKGAIIALTHAMARDYGPDIRANCICPGAIQTDMLDEYLARCNDPNSERNRIVTNLPLQRLGSPEDIANAVLFLASDMSSWITGQVLIVDGGDTA